jgi:PKHD-type hydroxylase
MAYQSVWYSTGLPESIVDSIEEDLKPFQMEMEQSRLSGNNIDENTRNSKNAWVPSNHWLAGLMWYFVDKANQENFRYDITAIDGGSMQFTQYNEGNFYRWHKDVSISTYHTKQATSNQDPNTVNDFLAFSNEYVRKLSFILQLSDHNSYEGGNVQLLDEDGKKYFIPRQRGTVIVFDSRTSHRVLKVTRGVRKSIVGWCVGPRWK